MTASQGEGYDAETEVFDDEIDELARAVERRIAEQAAVLDELSAADDQIYEVTRVGLQTNAI